MERLGPLEDLRREFSAVSKRLDALREEASALDNDSREYMQSLRRRAVWWRRLSGTWVDQTVRSYWDRAFQLHHEVGQLKAERDRLEWKIKDAKKVKRRLLNAQIASNARRIRERDQAEQYEKFSAFSAANLSEVFRREDFDIRREDYRRGNEIDNYFRDAAARVLAAFEHRCLFCGTTEWLTFDHYALSKNEGGNFALMSADKLSIRLNIVVLCRSCNSAKAQVDFMHFFDEPLRIRAASCQHILLTELLGDRQFLRLINRRGVKIAISGTAQ